MLSSCLISGVFPLASGECSEDSVFYATYLSSVEFSDPNHFINVSVRKFTPATEEILEDGTYVFLLGKVAVIPGGEDSFIDILKCVPFIHPPEGFETCYYPNEPTHTAVTTGTVVSVGSMEHIRMFTVKVTDWVRGVVRTFNARFRFDGSLNRWKNVRLPSIGQTVIATGTFLEVPEDGRSDVILNLLDINYGDSSTATPMRTAGNRQANKPSSPDPGLLTPTRPVGYRRRNAPGNSTFVDPQTPSSPTPATTGRGNKAKGKAPAKRVYEEVEEIDEDEAVEAAPKATRTQRRGRGGKFTK